MELVPGAGISDEAVAGSGPLVRALVVQRLEMMWRGCEPFINTDLGKPDPRFIEAGIRIVDRLTRLYRLDAPAAAENEPDSGSIVDQRAVAGRMLEELEAKINDLGR